MHGPAVCRRRCRPRLPWVCVLAWAALGAACATTTSTFSPAELAPLDRLRPIEDDVVNRAVAAAPEDATLVRLEQAFALLRRARSDDDVARARTQLEQAYLTFEDLRDPENMSVAFTVDGNTPYRGRPHERVLAATTLALTDAVNGRCDLALPTLKAAEFLDVRWQRLAFGTDAAAVYALSVYCLAETNGREEDVRRAEEGLGLTYRYAAGESVVRALVDEAMVRTARRQAVATMVAGELLKLGMLTTLANNPRVEAYDDIVAGAVADVAVVTSRADEIMALPAFDDALRVSTAAAGGSFADKTTAQRFVRNHVVEAVDELARILVQLPASNAAKTAFAEAMASAKVATDESLRQLRTSRVQLRFSGLGPMVVREGEYDEIARIVPRDGAETSTALRTTTASATEGACGIRGERDGAGFVATLCGTDGRRQSSPSSSATSATALEIWSSSAQATTVVGRRFDTILKGRAAFKAGSSAVSSVAVWSARGLLETGFALLQTCGDGPAASTKTKASSTKKQAEKPPASASADDVCVGVAMATITIGAVALGIGGVAWLAGAVVNAEADPRFVGDLPERVELLLPGTTLAPSPPRSSSPSSNPPPSSTASTSEQR